MAEKTVTPSEIATLRAAVSILTARHELAAAGGLTFDGLRNLSLAFGYKPTLQVEDYRIRYTRGGLAARVIDLKPDSTWVEGAEVIEVEDREVITPFEAEVDELFTRLEAWSVFHRADKLAGIGRYAVMLIGAPGDLEKPLPRLRGPQDIFFLSPFAEDDAKIDKSDVEVKTDTPRFGLPNYYRLKRISPVTNEEKRVHWSRIIHVAEGALDDKLYGPPRLERVWNLCDDLDKVTGGGSEAFFQRAHQGYHLNIDKDTKIPAGAAGTKILDDLSAEADEFVHGMRRFLRTHGAEVTSLGSDVADFKGPSEAIIAQIAGAIPVPQRIFLGSERGELASSSDKITWDESMTRRRAQYAFPVLIKQLVDRLIGVNALSKPSQYVMYWPNSDNHTLKEKSEIAERLSKVNAQFGEVVITRGDIRDRILGWPVATDEVSTERDDADEEEDEEEAAELAAALARNIASGTGAMRQRVAEAVAVAAPTGETTTPQLPPVTINLPPAQITVNVPPNNESVARTYEYDSLGRIVKSVPEVHSGNGNRTGAV